MAQMLRFRLASERTAKDPGDLSDLKEAIARSAPGSTFPPESTGAGAPLAEAIIVVLIPAVAKVVVAAIGAFAAYVTARKRAKGGKTVVLRLRGADATVRVELNPDAPAAPEPIESALKDIGELIEIAED